VYTCVTEIRDGLYFLIGGHTTSYEFGGNTVGVQTPFLTILGYASFTTYNDFAFDTVDGQTTISACAGYESYAEAIVVTDAPNIIAKVDIYGT
jgi:hypothetical protein